MDAWLLRYLKGPGLMASATASQGPESLSSAGNLARPGLLQRPNNGVDETELQPLVFPSWLRCPGLRQELFRSGSMGWLKPWCLAVGLGRGWTPALLVSNLSQP